MWLPSDWAKYISGSLLILGEVQMTVFPCLAGLIWENVVWKNIGTLQVYTHVNLSTGHVDGQKC